MKPKLLQASAAIVAVAIFTSACENLTPGENAAVFGTAAGLATGIPLVASGVNPNIAIPVTAGAVAVAAVGAYIIAKHQATERQRKIAEQRARLYMAQTGSCPQGGCFAAVLGGQKKAVQTTLYRREDG